MQKRSKHYEFRGTVLNIPMFYDELTGTYIEEYRNFNEEPAWTADGAPFIHSVEDPCPHGEWETPYRGNTCGECRYFKPIAKHTLIGICQQQKRRWANKPQEVNL